MPEQSDLRQVQFCEGWTEANGTLVTQLDFGIRGAGWHFMWIAGSHSSQGLGRTAETATRRALIRALTEVGDGFNAAELGSLNITSFFGIQKARVTVYTRHIQKEPSLDGIEAIRLQELPER